MLHSAVADIVHKAVVDYRTVHIDWDFHTVGTDYIFGLAVDHMDCSVHNWVVDFEWGSALGLGDFALGLGSYLDFAVAALEVQFGR